MPADVLAAGKVRGTRAAHALDMSVGVLAARIVRGDGAPAVGKKCQPSAGSEKNRALMPVSGQKR